MKSTSEGEQIEPFIQPATDSKVTVIRKIQTAQAKMLEKTFCLVCRNTHSICVHRGGKCGFNAPNANSAPTKSAIMAFPWGMFAPTASQVYRMEISDFFHICNCIVFHFPM